MAKIKITERALSQRIKRKLNKDRKSLVKKGDKYYIVDGASIILEESLLKIANNLDAIKAYEELIN